MKTPKAGKGMKASETKIRQCRTIAFFGIAVMGVGSFMACLPSNETLLFAGSALMLLGIAVTAYGFTYWRP